MVQSMQRDGYKSNALCSGTSLIEMMIAMALITVVLGAIYSFLLTGHNSFLIGTEVLNLQQTSSTLTDQVSSRLIEARLISLNANGSAITFMVPVEDEGGEVIDSNFNVIWGAVDADDDVHVGGWYIYYFEGDETLSEVTLGVDINEDGDMADLFDKGALHVSVYNELGVLQTTLEMSQPFLIQTHPTAGGDVDADDEDDPIFSRVDTDGNPDTLGMSIRIRFIAVWIDGDTKAYLRKVDTAISFRNPQD